MLITMFIQLAKHCTTYICNEVTANLQHEHAMVVVVYHYKPVSTCGLLSKLDAKPHDKTKI
jgi:hypothetical protein